MLHKLNQIILKLVSKLKVGFLDKNIYLDKSTHPKLIKDTKPKWYKDMPLRLLKKTPVGNQQIKTVKGCPSFVDTFKNGLIIYAPTDIKLFVNGDFAKFELPYKSNYYFVDTHTNDQFINYLPDTNYKRIFKIVLPLAIFTEKGYSCYQYNYPFDNKKGFETIFGQFETDKIHEVNIQVAFTSDEDEIIIEKGTPLCIYMPYKRNEIDLDMFYLPDKTKYMDIYERQWFKLNSKFNKYYGTL